MELKPYARRALWNDTVQIVFKQIFDNGDKAVSEPLTFRKLSPGDSISEPTVELSMHEAQRLMDELWDCGLRPSEGTGSAGAMAAMQQHLKDLQKLVFKDGSK